MSLANIIKQDFLAYFKEKIIDSHEAIVEYSIVSSDGLVHTIYIDPRDNLVGLSVTAPGDTGTAVNIMLYNITNIRCVREDMTVKFYFYQGSRPDAIAEMMVDPSIYINVDVQS